MIVFIDDSGDAGFKIKKAPEGAFFNRTFYSRDFLTRHLKVTVRKIGLCTSKYIKFFK